MQQRVMRAAVAAALALAGCRDRGPVAVIRGPGGVVEVSLEVAATPAEQERGLMYRSSLADGRGMLFVFDEDGDHGFWMKNTFIPLDMLFIARDGTVAGITRTRRRFRRPTSRSGSHRATCSRSPAAGPRGTGLPPARRSSSA